MEFGCTGGTGVEEPDLHMNRTQIHERATSKEDVKYDVIGKCICSYRAACEAHKPVPITTAPEVVQVRVIKTRPGDPPRRVRRRSAARVIAAGRFESKKCEASDVRPIASPT